MSTTQPPLASELTISPNITMSFSGMFMNYSEHLCGAETILLAKKRILYGYTHWPI